MWFSKDDVLTFNFYDEDYNLLSTKTKTIQESEANYKGILEMPELTINAAAPATTGTAKAKLDGANEVDVTWVQLWADGPKWATINVGVTSTTATGTDLYGGLYRWGGTNEMRANTSLGDDHNTGSANLSGDNDTATKLWGSNWRMPTEAELQGLIDNCTWSSFSGGYTVTGQGDYASNSIFLPAAGYFGFVASWEVTSAGSYGYYWSSAPYSSSAYNLLFNSSAKIPNGSNRNVGCSVRAVVSD